MMNQARQLFNFGLLVALVVFTTGCSSFGKKLKSWMNGGDSSPQAKAVTTPKFSDTDNLRAGSGAERQYRRMNRQRLEEEADVKADAGSLWVMEGQGAYLFAQNQMRMVGDLLNVKIEGAPKTQLQTKVRVISKLLERLENPRGLASAGGANRPGAAGQGGQPAPAAANPAGAAPNPQGQNPAAPNPGGDPNQQAQAGAENDASKAEPPFAVQTVPTRIVEQLKDGSYRVRGMQPFMIGKREYKVIVTGIVRAEDFDDAGIDAPKLLDPQFDIVSSKKGASM